MTDELITERELALWTQTPEEAIASDPFAAEVREKVSDYVRSVAGQTRATWTVATLPYDARVIVLWMAKRTYSNPDQVVQESVGPLSERRLDEAAMGMALTESERETLEGYKSSGAGGGLYTMSIDDSRPGATQAVVFVPDDSYSDWYIPMFNPLDPGDPNLYPPQGG
jgi:hypothetical protein